MMGFALALTQAGCGGGGNDGGGTPTPVPTPTPCTQSTILQTSGIVESLTLVYDDFSVPESGRLDITMDWTNASSLMGLYLVPANSCTLAEFNARTCNFFVRSETTTKPRKISYTATAGNYRYIVGNFSDDLESATLQIVLSKGSCPAFGAAPSASTVHAGALPEMERLLRR